MSPTAPTRSPFDDADADIIFRSSDGVDFRLYKVILAKASPVFRTMLALPQPSSPTTDATTEPEAIPLTEDAKTLENLFRFCYPVAHPLITSVDDLHAILEAARKYEMASVTANARSVIAHILSKEPLRIYAIAYILQIEDVAREAANLLLDIPEFHVPPSPPPEFTILPSLAIYAIHTYRQKCVTATLRVLEDQDWVFNGSHERAVQYPNGINFMPDVSMSWIWLACSSVDNEEVRMRLGSNVYCLHKWYETYIKALKLALTERPSGRTIRLLLASTWAHEALTQAASCSICMPKVYADLARFNELLAERIDHAIAEVSLELPFTSTKDA